jgi:tetratricopeptide (TPR) repeat protein
MKAILVVSALLVSAGLVYFLTRGSGFEASVAAPPPAASHRPAEQAPPAPALTPAIAAPRTAPVPLRDAALEAYRKQLLDLAFTTASLVPSMPHVKTRSRCQEEVVGACFELEQPARALQYVEEIDNWRRGVGYADVACWLAQEGRADDALGWTAKANEFVERMQLMEENEESGLAELNEVEGYQSWRKDRIRARIARSFLLLGDEDGALTFIEGLEASESGIVEAAWAERAELEDVVEQVRVLREVSGAGDFDRVQNAAEVGLVLYARFHAHADERERIASALRECFDRSPVMFRIDGHVRLGVLAAEHGDDETALGVARAMEDLLAETPLATEDLVPVLGRLAELRVAAGDADGGRALAEKALVKYEAGRAAIESLCRAETLVPIATTFLALGERERALELYRRAVRDGAENPNAVPRAEDLCATLVSMARHAVEPDPELWAEVRAIHAGLREPW